MATVRLCHSQGRDLENARGPRRLRGVWLTNCGLLSQHDGYQEWLVVMASSEGWVNGRVLSHL